MTSERQQAKKEKRLLARIHYLDAYHVALELVKRAGFVLHNVSMQSETCYYFHPSRGSECLLRVSTHRYRGPTTTFSNVVSVITISSKDNTHNPTNTYNRVSHGIGRYFLEERRPSQYQGKRGTWEMSALRPDVQDAGSAERASVGETQRAQTTTDASR